MLADWILIFKESLRKRLIDHGYLPRRRGVLVCNRSAQHDFCPYGLEESRHDSHKSCARVLLCSGLCSALDTNAVVPAITRHRRIKCRGYHPHTGNLPQAIIDFTEHWFHLLRLVVSQHRIDPCDIPALRLESEILMLQVSQAVSQQSSRRQ